MYNIFYFIYMLIQHFYMLFIYANRLPVLTKTTVDYTIDDVSHKMVVYKTNRQLKKYILFISGSYQLLYDVYIYKTIRDLQESHTNLFYAYELIVFEKPDKSNITIYKDIIEYINKNIAQDIEELVIFGFSSGGVVASHILSNLKHIKCSKKLITYDTPWQVMDNVRSFQHNWVYRIDILFFTIVYNIYNNHYNIDEIRSKLIKSGNPFKNGGKELVKLIQNIHNFTDDEMYDITGFNLAQEPTTKIINIWCKRDPFINRVTHNNYIRQRQDKVDLLNILNIEKLHIGHCTDMAYDSKYIKDIARALYL